MYSRTISGSQKPDQPTQPIPGHRRRQTYKDEWAKRLGRSHAVRKIFALRQLRTERTLVSKRDIKTFIPAGPLFPPPLFFFFFFFSPPPPPPPPFFFFPFIYRYAAISSC